MWLALGSPLVELTNQWLPARSPCTVTLNQQEESELRETNARSAFFSVQGRREANALGGWGWHYAWIQIFGRESDQWQRVRLFECCSGFVCYQAARGRAQQTT